MYFVIPYFQHHSLYCSEISTLIFSSMESGAEWLMWPTVDWWQSQRSRRFATFPPCSSFTKTTCPPCRGPTLFQKLTILKHWKTTSSRILTRYSFTVSPWKMPSPFPMCIHVVCWAKPFSLLVLHMRGGSSSIDISYCNAKVYTVTSWYLQCMWKSVPSIWVVESDWSAKIQ